MRADGGRDFSLAMTRFLEQQCVIGFKAFWKQAPERFDHPSLLGQFRVELVKRGFYTEPGGKRPHWRGLITRERDNQGYEEEIARTQAG